MTPEMIEIIQELDGLSEKDGLIVALTALAHVMEANPGVRKSALLAIQATKAVNSLA